MTSARDLVSVLVLCLVVLWMALPAAAQPSAGNREIVSPATTTITKMSALQCGTQIVARGNGSSIEVPKFGDFAVRCWVVTVVDASERIVSSMNTCDPPKFVGC